MKILCSLLFIYIVFLVMKNLYIEGKFNKGSNKHVASTLKEMCLA